MVPRPNTFQANFSPHWMKCFVIGCCRQHQHFLQLAVDPLDSASGLLPSPTPSVSLSVVRILDEVMLAKINELTTKLLPLGSVPNESMPWLAVGAATFVNLGASLASYNKPYGSATSSSSQTQLRFHPFLLDKINPVACVAPSV